MRHMLRFGTGCFLCAVLASPQISSAATDSIPLETLEPPERTGATRSYPVAVGLVFPEGDVTSLPAGQVRDDTGKVVPCTSEVTGWWDAGRRSIKWLLLRFRADTDRRYDFTPGGEAVQPSGDPLATQQAGVISVNTGPLSMRLSGVQGRLADELRLNGRRMLADDGFLPVLKGHDGKQPVATQLSHLRMDLEHAGPDRASIRAQGEFLDPAGTPFAGLIVRYHFFRGESFIRLYCTLVWMKRDPAMGATEFALVLSPDMGDEGVARIGLSEYASDSVDVPYESTTRVAAQQLTPDAFSVVSGDTTARRGTRLGGWFSFADETGRGMGVSVRELWQLFPKAFVFENGVLRLQLWPDSAPRMAFEPQDLMPRDFFENMDYWKSFKWMPEDATHFLHEYHQHSHFEHTPEGAARTHEIVLFFFDETSARTTAALNSVNQHPIVIRQDPASVARVPIQGLYLTPVNHAQYPDMERAIDQVGRMATSRWTAAHDYGFWRYGMTRWGGTGLSYRWFDGHQYDMQLIPWLLFLRGGGRHWYEQGEATARFAMDVATTHHSTRGYPAGNQAAAGALPFPWAAKFLTKAPKVHFLAHYHHVTGYRRAREVLDLVVEGNRAQAASCVRPLRHQGRELYNMNAFWVNAYEETGDPEIKGYAREWLDKTLDVDYDRAMNAFRAPNIYLYPGLVLQHALWQDDRARSVMLRNLEGLGYPDTPWGGVYRGEDAVACQWAYRQTGDKRFAAVAWDIARTLADVVADHDWSSPEIPWFPAMGHSFWRQFLGPMLVGYSLGAELGMQRADAFQLCDTYLTITPDPAVKGRVSGKAFVRPRRSGPLEVRFIFAARREEPAGDMAVTAFDGNGRQRAHAAIPEAPPGEARDRFYPLDWRAGQRGRLIIPDAEAGHVYTLVIAGDARGAPLVLVLSDAALVQECPPGQLLHVYNLAGQYYVGTRIFARTTGDTLTVTSPYRKPYTVRDAETGEVLHRSRLVMESPKRIQIGAGRLIQVTMTGRIEGKVFEGISPYVARTREAWFDPTR